MTGNYGFYCNIFGGLAGWVYAELGLESTRLINLKNCAKMATDPEYVGEISSVRYGLNTNNMILL